MNTLSNYEEGRRRGIKNALQQRERQKSAARMILSIIKKCP